MQTVRRKQSFLIRFCIWFLVVLFVGTLLVGIWSRYVLFRRGITGRAVITADVRQDDGPGAGRTFTKITHVSIVEPIEYAGQTFGQSKFLSLRNYTVGETVPVFFVPGENDKASGENGTKSQVIRGSFTSPDAVFIAAVADLVKQATNYNQQ